LLCKNLLLGSPRHLLRSPRAATAAAAAASSYYCRRLITRRLRRRGMALSAGDVPTMYAVLVNSLSADEAARRPAEAALAQCETRPGFCSCLLEIISARGLACREDVRLLATVYFKNSINRYWRHRRDS